MKNIIINLFFITVLTFNLEGKELNKSEVHTFAEKWMLENEYVLHYGQYKTGNEIFRIKKINSVKNDMGKPIFYVAELTPIGFILFSADDILQPIIGYSSENNFNYNYKQNNTFLNSIVTDLSSNLAKIKQVSSNTNKWKNYYSVKLLKENIVKTDSIYGPFLQSDWGQGYVNGNPVYNYFTPHNWPAGCVATATAQILNYYKWPYKGFGKHGYYDNGQYLSADFSNTIYDWANTLDQYENTYFNLANQKAAGLLTFHCAVALNMDFESSGSTASTTDVPAILHNYFSFSGHYKSKSKNGFWEELKNNMLNERPAIISIKSTSHSVGHAAVVDGYFETNNYYHVNPGWYGSNTGWYNISGSWNMGSYDIVVGAVKGIVPSPQINDPVRLGENSFILSWKTSRYQKADFYELQQARSYNGPWITISNNIIDSIYQFNNVDLEAYYYKVRANSDNIWWDYSNIKKIRLGTERTVVFQVDMTYKNLNSGDTLVIRGNTPPLRGNLNSPPMIKVDSSNVYKLSLNFDYDYVGQNIIYRFFIQSGTGLTAEGENREYVLTSEPLQILPVVYFDNIVSVDDNKNLTAPDFNLEQNYPNPFNPVTTIKYSIPSLETSHDDMSHGEIVVQIKVYDILGKEIATLVNKKQSAGNYSVMFDASNLSSGIYYYRLQYGSNVKTKKLILLK